jgi:hypothetical protein
MKKHLLILIFLIITSLFSSAQITFQKTYGGTFGYAFYSVKQTTDSGYIFAGLTTVWGAGNVDGFLIKTNAYGDTLWTKTYGGFDNEEIRSVEQTSDGGYIAAGITSSFGGGSVDVCLIKTNASGNLLWTKTFGGTGFDFGFSVQQTFDGGYIVSGSTLGPLGDDIYLIKTDSNGDSLWTRLFGGPSSARGNSVKQTSDSGYVVVGFTLVGTSSDVYMIKTNSTGNVIWSKTYGGAGLDEGMSVQQTTDGGYVIAGYTASFGAGSDDFYLIKTNANGDALWTKTYGGVNLDKAFSVQQTNDGGYIISGNYLIKTDAIGDTLWTRVFLGLNGLHTCARQCFDGGYIISFTSGTQIYLIKTDANGNSGCNQTSSQTIITTPATQVNNPTTIISSNSNIATSPITLVGSGGGAITTLCSSVSINEITKNNSFLVYPNPANDIITINSTNNFPATEIILFDASGRAVVEKKLNKEASFSVKELNAGI